MSLYPLLLDPIFYTLRIFMQQQDQFIANSDFYFSNPQIYNTDNLYLNNFH